MKYYVIPDIHGRNDLLQLALAAIYEQNPNGGTRIVFLGDYIDRGPEGIQVLQTVMNPPEGWEFVTLKGNHEDMFVGGYHRQNEYYDPKFVDQVRNSDMSFSTIARWFESLPLAYREGQNVFAHAWFEADRPVDQQVDTMALWARFPDEMAYDGNGLFLTHGHTPRRHGPIFAPNRLNLDCGAVFADRLVVAEFEEGKTGPVGFQQFMTNTTVD